MGRETELGEISGTQRPNCSVSDPMSWVMELLGREPVMARLP